MNFNNERCQIAKAYNNMITAFNNINGNNINLKSRNISKEIYWQVFQIRYAGWKHRVDFKRGKKHSIADIFQDIIAYYLKACLQEPYEVILEKKIGKVQPDILINKNKKPHFLIETKTNSGWNRMAMEKGKLEERMKNIADAFLPSSKKENVIFILEHFDNIRNDFKSLFWSDGSPKTPKNNPYKKTYPLFIQTDPYYLKEYTIDKNINREIEYPEITDKEIEASAEKYILRPFEDIIKLITG